MSFGFIKHFIPCRKFDRLFMDFCDFSFEEGEELFLIFADESSGISTYGGGRYLYAERPYAEGRVILDFNKFINPPCVFTPYATCPLPPNQNILEIMIEAGEMDSYVTL